MADLNLSHHCYTAGKNPEKKIRPLFDAVLQHQIL